MISKMYFKQHGELIGYPLETNACFGIRTTGDVLPNVDRNQIPILFESIVDIVGAHLSWNVQQVDRTSFP